MSKEEQEGESQEAHEAREQDFSRKIREAIFWIWPIARASILAGKKAFYPSLDTTNFYRAMVEVLEDSFLWNPTSPDYIQHIDTITKATGFRLSLKGLSREPALEKVKNWFFVVCTCLARDIAKWGDSAPYWATGFLQEWMGLKKTHKKFKEIQNRAKSWNYMKHMPRDVCEWYMDYDEIPVGGPITEAPSLDTQRIEERIMSFY